MSPADKSSVAAFDVFNGDADGICALHQLRLAMPADATLITGVKRDIQLLQRFHSSAGDQITVLDISLDANVEALKQHLNNGARVVYFDHHSADRAFAHPLLDLYWDDACDTCTSLLVNRYLNGKYVLWAMVAAFGDNLMATAHAMAAQRRLTTAQELLLSKLGTLLNYNSYGEKPEDLAILPVELYRNLHNYPDPFEFAANSFCYSLLQHSYTQDMSLLQALQPSWQQSNGAIYLLPNQTWAKRISGLLANRLAEQDKCLSFAVLSEKTDGSFLVSVRAANPRLKPASEFCACFPGGGGRRAAAGVNSLPASELSAFTTRFFSYF
ncbi:hypothetical protein LPB67_14015 [Undibacterium sp. Jales W-56]|uniref:hypothetical protein n=1 Tax=Undibacterium sp. Jales W-56 TaxID=2897325 RepID=UPI0021D23428|nr:hypothetical protein [Undibacterium sp. Jales W-56]MCU6434888.1 hypothetical protein [Undibacterium sp. Jales W-56]